MGSQKRVRALIDLGAFSHNLDEIKKNISDETRVIAVIKTDGYGHGAVPLARVLEERDEVWGFGVATIEEAEELWEAGLKKPSLILGYVFPEDLLEAVRIDARCAVFSYESARLIDEAASSLGKTAYIHIKLDTGMGRIGYECSLESADEICRISALKNVRIEGLFTHFARSDERDKSYTISQAQRYLRFRESLEERQVDIPLCHISNSAAIMDLPEYDMDLVRAGIILYGLWPSDEVMRERLDLEPVMELKSHIAFIKEIDAGQSLSYGGTYTADERRVIATIPAGYGDGYPRSLSNRASVLIRGKRAPIRGRICMDQFMADITDIPGARVGDEVTLIGRDKDEQITMDELSSLSGRFNYEFACCIGKRVPRIYISSGNLD